METVQLGCTEGQIPGTPTSPTSTRALSTRIGSVVFGRATPSVSSLVFLMSISSQVHSQSDVLFCCFVATLEKLCLAKGGFIYFPVDANYNEHWEVEGSCNGEEDIAQLLIDCAEVRVVRMRLLPSEERTDGNQNGRDPY